MDSEKIINIIKKKTKNKNNHRCFALCLVIRVHLPVVSFHISLQTYDHVHSMES